MVYRRARAVSALSLTILSMVGCARMESSPTAPTVTPAATAAPLTLTIRVHERSRAETPIAGALVVHESTGLYTDATGVSHIIVQSGRETTIDVSAHGYRPMQASAVLNSSERWTFFLEPEP